MHRVTGMEHVFLGIESDDFPMDGAAILMLDPSTADGDWGYDAVREAFARGVPTVDVMTRRLVEGPSITPGYWTAYWATDPNFDVDAHLERVTVPAPGDTAALAQLCLELSAGRLARDRPLWKAWYVDGVADGRAAVILRVHHAAVDGIAGMEMFAALLDTEPNPRRRRTPERLEGEIPSHAGLLARSARDLATLPLDAARNALALGSGIVSGRRAAAGADRGRLFRDTREQLFNRHVESPEKSLALVELSLAEVKAVKNQLGVSLADVVLALVTSSLRTYLFGRGEAVDEPLMALCPINVRAGSERAGAGNHWAMMFNRLPVHLDDPVERLGAIRQETETNKRVAQARARVVNPAAAIADIVPPPAWQLAGKLVNLPLGRLMPPIANVEVSSIPGSPVPLYLAGARLTHMHSRTFVQQGSGLFIACVGYADSLDISITSLRELVPDPEAIGGSVERALVELASSTQESPTNLRASRPRPAARW